MKYKLSDFAKIGNLNVVIDGGFDDLGMIDDCSDNSLTIYYDKRFYNYLKNSGIVAIITKESFVSDFKDIAVATSNNPVESFYKIHNYLSEYTNHYGVNEESYVGSNTHIDKSVKIPTKNVHIGDNCHIEENVTIYENSYIESNVRISSGTRIGCEGFEVKQINDQNMLIPHAGSVRIGHNVEILSNCTIARGLGRRDTEIGDFTKIDTMCHIAHGVKIGHKTLIASGSTICGSVEIGDEVWVGPNSTISNGIRICNNARITIGSTVINDVESNGHVTGYFSINHKDYIKQKYKVSKL